VAARDGASAADRNVFDHLIEIGDINLKRGAIFGVTPEPLPHDFDFGCIEGMMLALAVGDALGNTTEGMLPAEGRRRHGEITDYLPNPYAGTRGVPSDDTQLAFWTLEQMIADGGLVPEHVAARFCQDTIFGIGRGVREFVRNYPSGLPWYQCGAKSAGNGALMRIAPALIPHLKPGTSELWSDAGLLAPITHRDSASMAACFSFVDVLWELLRAEPTPRREWWLETYVGVARELESGRSYRPRGGDHTGYQGPLWRFVEERVGAAFDAGLSVLDACNSWHSGAYLLERVPSVIYILMKHGHDIEEAIVRAVNDTKDNDTIAPIVGAAVGALHGRKAIPPR